MYRPTIPKVFGRSLTLLALLLLTACGSGFRELINPPGASVQQLHASAEGKWQVTLRLQNYSNVRTEFARIDLVLAISGVRAGTLQRDTSMTVEADSVELIQFDVVPSDAARAALAAPSVRDTGIVYRLDGRLATRDPRGNYPLAHDSRLTPVPGRPGEFR